MARPTTEAIWLHLSSDLRQFIRRRVSDEHTAEDLLQETFVRVHRNIATLREADRMAAWVYQIARNVVHDHHRKTPPSTAALLDADPIDESEHRSQSGSERVAWLNAMIRTLPSRYREAVQLAEMEQLSQQEVADRLGLSLSGAKSRIQRGRAMLRNVLEACCTFELDRRGAVMGCSPKPNQPHCRECENSS